VSCLCICKPSSKYLEPLVNLVAMLHTYTYLYDMHVMRAYVCMYMSVAVVYIVALSVRQILHVDMDIDIDTHIQR